MLCKLPSKPPAVRQFQNSCRRMTRRPDACFLPCHAMRGMRGVCRQLAHGLPLMGPLLREQ